MNERDISSLNRTLKIHFPMDELAVYMHGSELDDKAVPILAKSLSILGLPLPKVPNKIVFRSCWSVPDYDPDETISLLSIKKNNPNVEFRKLERLYKNNMLSKYLWEENFSAKDVNWRELLILKIRQSLLLNVLPDNYIKLAILSSLYLRLKSFLPTNILRAYYFCIVVLIF